MDGSENERTEDVQREVDDRIDDLMREGKEMEKRLDSAGDDAADVDVPDRDEPSGPGLQPSDLVADESDESDARAESDGSDD